MIREAEMGAPGDAGGIGSLELIDILDSAAIQALMDDFYKLAHVPMAIIDLKGKVLVGVGWQRICTEFHRVHPQTCRFCTESDLQLTAGVPPGEFRLYRCKNNMWDVSTPLMVNGRHMGNLFMGQFFFEGEVIDRDLFRKQAKQYGFDEKEYLAALEAAPRLTRDTVNTGMSFLMKLAHMLSGISHSNIRLSHALAERDRLMESLRESEEQARRLATFPERNPNPIVELDIDGKIQYANPTAIRLFPDLPEKGEAHAWLAGWRHDARAFGTGEMQSVVRDVSIGELHYHQVLQYLAELGRIRIYGTDITRRKKAEAERQRLIEDLEAARSALEQRVNERTAELSETVSKLRAEVIERQRVEEELRHASHYARSLLEASLDPLVTISAEGKITDVNEATEAATGRTRAELIGSDFSNYFTEPENARAGYQRVLAEGLVRDYPLTVRHASGQTMDVLYNATVYRDEQGNALGVFAAARDITARKRAEEELEEYRKNLEKMVEQRTAELARSNEELGHFAYVASHDLQEPLRVITGYLQLLQRREGDKLDAEGKEFIKYVVEAGAHMQQLINDLLAYSRVGSRGKPFEATDMEVVLARALAILRHSIEESGAEVTHDPLPTIRVDAMQIVQLLQNLISNAIKFHGERTPRIHVGASRDDEGWLFSVKDNGIGIEPQYWDQIFVIFQRLHTRQKYKGTGIGLAICKKIVERHGGRIWLTSQPGQGTTFYFRVEEKL